MILNIVYQNALRLTTIGVYSDYSLNYFDETDVFWGVMVVGVRAFFDMVGDLLCKRGDLFFIGEGFFSMPMISSSWNGDSSASSCISSASSRVSSATHPLTFEQKRPADCSAGRMHFSFRWLCRFQPMPRHALCLSPKKTGLVDPLGPYRASLSRLSCAFPISPLESCRTSSPR